MNQIPPGPNLRVAVVGCGYWGSKHVRVLSQLAGIAVVIVDIDENRRKALSATFPTAGSYAELADALAAAESIDAAIIATKPTTHHELASLALDAGLHVLVEKPLATRIADSLDLIARAQHNDRVLMTGHTFEYNPAVWKLKEIVSRPEFGQVLYIDAARLNLGLYQPDVNVLWDLAPHDISIINFLLERLPTEVCAWASRHADLHEDVGYLQLRYGDTSLTANVHVSWLHPNKIRRITVVGTNQMAVYDDVATDDRIRVYDKGLQRQGALSLHEQPMSYRNGDITSPYIDIREPLQIEAEQFIESIRNGSTPRSDGWSGLDVVRVLVAANCSIESGTGERLAQLPAGPTAVPPVPAPVSTSITRLLGSLDRKPGGPVADTGVVSVELVGAPPSILTQALFGELALAGFAPCRTTGAEVAVQRPDGAMVSISSDSVPFANGVNRLTLRTVAYPIGAAIEAALRSFSREGYRVETTTESYLLRRPGSAGSPLVRIGRPSARRVAARLAHLSAER